MYVNPILIGFSILLIGFGFLYRFMARPRFPIASLTVVLILLLFLGGTFLINLALEPGFDPSGLFGSRALAFFTATKAPKRSVCELAFLQYKWADICLILLAFATMALDIWSGLVHSKPKK